MTQIQIELALLHAELQNVAPHIGIKDSINWDRHAAGKFTTASAYKFITNTPHIRVSTGRLWKIGVSLRVAVFIWFMLNDSILTIDNLRRRGFQLTNICPLCWKDNETVQHLFYSCSYTTNIRSYIQATMLGSSAPSITQTTTDFLLSRDQDKRQKQLEVTIIFTLWKERYRRTFENKNQTIVEITREILR
jgi:zinc-binding in reverse transcriptase